jgi:methionyl aminopeptidase
MKTNLINNFNENNIVRLKNNDWLEKQRIAGKISAKTLILLENEVKQRTTKTLLELDKLAETYIRDNGGYPTFLMYKGFPNSVCISVNKEVVHGIPKNYELQDGDIISFDLGVTYKGAIADTAITCIYGKAKSDRHRQLLKLTEESLMKGIEAVKVGDRVGVIGKAIYKHAHSQFGVINNYGGHGLDWDTPHAAPFIENRSDETRGIRIQPGLAIAIEPMLVLGSTATTTLDDGWTVVTPDLSAHVEHSIFVHNDRIEIITWRENEQYPREILFKV